MNAGALEARPADAGVSIAAPAGVAGRRAAVELRSFQPSYLDSVLELYREVFGPQPAADYQERWRWSQEENLYPANTPRWVLLAGGRAVGFLATVPQPYWFWGRTIVAHTPCDYMVHRDYRFHGLKLMQAFFRECEHCVSCDDVRATIDVTRWLGATGAGAMVRYAKLLDARALRTRRRRQVLYAPLAWTAVQALRLRDRLFSPRSDITVLPVDTFDDCFDLFAQRMAGNVPVMVAAGSRFLEWRYGAGSPHRARRIAIATNRVGAMVGYVITYQSPGPDHAGHVLDLRTLPPADPDIAAALLHHAVTTLRRSGAWIVYCRHIASPFMMPVEVLREQGFVRRGQHELLVRLADRQLAELAARIDNWQLSYGDSEASHATV